MYYGDYSLLEQARISEQLGDAIIDAILAPIHRKGILTYHMAPAPLPVQVFRGPTMLTVAIRLQEPERDLAAVLRLGPALKQYLGRALGIHDRDDHFQVRVRDGNQSILVELPHPTPEIITLTDVKALSEQLIFLGIDQFNEMVTLDLWKVVPGMIVSGRPGSGKTNAMRNMAVQALAGGWQLYLIAAKGIRAGHDSSEWEDIAPHCAGVAVTPEEIAALLAELDELLAARAAGSAAIDHGVLLVVDELRELDKETQRLYARLARLRRSAAFRTIAGAQVVSKEIEFEVRGCLTTRLAGMAASATESDMATGAKSLGAEHLTGKGDMLLVQDGGRATRLAVAKADAEDVAAHLAQLSPAPEAPTSSHHAASSVAAHHAPAKEASAFDLIVERWQREADETGRGATPPPDWLLGKGVAHASRYQEMPSFALLREWHIERKGKGLSQRRLEQIREAIAELMPAVL